MNRKRISFTLFAVLPLLLLLLVGLAQGAPAGHTDVAPDAGLRPEGIVIGRDVNLNRSLLEEVTVSEPSAFTLRINSGGGEVVDGAITWEDDAPYVK